MSLPCIAWSRLVSGPRRRCCKFLPSQSLHVWLLQSDFSSWSLLVVFPACLADTTQELPIPSAVIRLIKYEQYQLGFCIQSELCNGSTSWARRPLCHLSLEQGTSELDGEGCKHTVRSHVRREKVEQWRWNDSAESELSHPRGSDVPC